MPLESPLRGTGQKIPATTLEFQSRKLQPGAQTPSQLTDVGPRTPAGRTFTLRYSFKDFSQRPQLLEKDPRKRVHCSHRHNTLKEGTKLMVGSPIRARSEGNSPPKIQRCQVIKAHRPNPRLFLLLPRCPKDHQFQIISSRDRSPHAPEKNIPAGSRPPFDQNPPRRHQPWFGSPNTGPISSSVTSTPSSFSHAPTKATKASWRVRELGSGE